MRVREAASSSAAAEHAEITSVPPGAAGGDAGRTAPPATAGGIDSGDASSDFVVVVFSVEPLLTCGLLTRVAEVGELGAEFVSRCGFCAGDASVADITTSIISIGR